MIKPFELGGLQMILSEPPMSNSSGGTHMDHASRPKFRIWQKLIKNAHFFIKYEIFIKKKNMIFVKRSGASKRSVIMNTLKQAM